MGRKHLRASHNLELHRTDIHGTDSGRYGCLRVMDAHMVRGGNMGLVIGILVIALILWWPRDKGE